MLEIINMDCIYDSLCHNPNFKEKYKIRNKKEFQRICKLMDSLGIRQNKKQEFFEQYYVPDLIGSECEILFVLESPHTDEIIHKHPLAGSSGLNLSKGLIDAGLKGITNTNGCYLPFGCWLQENIKTELGQQIGIMNVCNFPMQSVAYSCAETNVKKIGLLRNRITANTNKLMDFNCFEICNAITENVKTQMETIRNKDLLTKLKKNQLLKQHSLKAVVVCGNISLGLISYFDEFKNTRKLFIPHPSTQSWNKDETQKIKTVNLEKIVKWLTK